MKVVYETKKPRYVVQVNSVHRNEWEDYMGYDNPERATNLADEMQSSNPNEYYRVIDKR